MKIQVRKICLMGLFTGMALAMFTVEAALPSLPLFPYVKIGIANIITLVMLYEDFRPWECFSVLLARIILGALVTGRLMTVMFSGAGGILAFIVMYITRKLFSEKYTVITAIFGALAHNIGQTAVAIAVYGSFSILYYLPILILGGIGGGIVTGLGGMLILSLLKKAKGSRGFTQKEFLYDKGRNSKNKSAGEKIQRGRPDGRGKGRASTAKGAVSGKHKE